MAVEKIVINASPLILLCNSDLSHILPELFREMILLDAVREVGLLECNESGQLISEICLISLRSIGPTQLGRI
jgi:hypothetical protein